MTPAVTGALNTVLGTSGGMQVFAGPRDDPFFIDLEAAFCILPDRRPVAGRAVELLRALAEPAGHAVLLPEPRRQLRQRLQRQLDRDRAAHVA